MTAAWVLGEFLAQYGQVLGMLICLLSVLVVSLLWIKCKQLDGGRKILLFFLPLISLISMVTYFQAQKQTWLDQYIDRYPEHTKGIIVQGVITDIHPKDTNTWVYVTKNKVIIDENVLTTRDLIISIQKDAGSNLKIGNTIEVRGDLKHFDIATNPGQFNAKQYYRALKFDYLIFGNSIKIIRYKIDIIHQTLYEFRTLLRNCIRQICDQPLSGIYQSLLIGDKASLDEKTKELFTDSGISHILAISGLHISIIGIFLYQLIRRTSGSYRLAGICSILFLACYGFITGNSISAIRAIVMFGIYCGANICGRVYDLASSLALSCIFILTCYPLQLFQSGFQLSFMAVFGISVLYPILDEWYGGDNKWMKSMLLSISIQVFTLPILAYYYYQYSIYTIFINILILPVAPLLLLSALLSSFLGLISIEIGKFLAAAGFFIIAFYNKICQFTLSLPGARHMIGRPGVGKIFTYYFLVIVPFWWIRCKNKEYNCKKRDKRKANLAAFFFYALFLFVWIHPIKNNALEIVMLDVGQGDGIFIQVPNNITIFIDGGSSNKSKVGTNIIQPFLYSKGIKHLDYVIISHSDVDHTNGIVELIMNNRITIGKLLVPAVKNPNESLLSFIDFVRNNGIEMDYLVKGMELKCEDVQLTCLHPSIEYEIEDPNDSSIVLQLSYLDFSMLFTGDIGQNVENILSDLSDVDMLKVAHHGSKYSTSEKFLKSTNPKYAWISCGKNNNYGHPHQELLQRLQKNNVTIIQTSDSGAIIFKRKKNKWSVTTFLNGDIDKKE